MVFELTVTLRRIGGCVSELGGGAKVTDGPAL